MSLRTVAEFNHDYTHKIKDNTEDFANTLLAFLRGGARGEREKLERQYGLTLAETGHHSDERIYIRNGREAKRF